MVTQFRFVGHAPVDGEFRFGVPMKERSALRPLFWWDREFRERGISVSIQLGLNRGVPEGFDVVAVSSRALATLSVEEKLGLLERLRASNHKLIWLDQGDGTRGTNFEIIDAVDLYAKRHLLRNQNDYRHPGGAFGSHMAYYAELYGEERSSRRKFVPLDKKDLKKLRLGWGFHYSVLPTAWKIPRLLMKIKRAAPRIPAPDFVEVPSPGYRAASVGAFFFGRDEPTAGRARFEARRLVEQAGGIVLTSPSNRRQFHRMLTQPAIHVSPFGWGEMCYRDFEVALVGRLLAKPSVEHLVTFPQVLREHVNYLPLPWDPEKWVPAIEEAPDLVGLAQNLHEDFRREFAEEGRERFIQHVEMCLAGNQLCDHCRPLLTPSDDSKHKQSGAP